MADQEREYQEALERDRATAARNAAAQIEAEVAAEAEASKTLTNSANSSTNTSSTNASSTNTSSTNTSSTNDSSTNDSTHVPNVSNANDRLDGIDATSAVPAEPDADVSNALQVRFRLPGGESATRRFANDVTVGQVRAFVCQSLRHSNAQFALKMPFSNADFSAREAALAEIAGGAKSLTLIVEDD